MSSRWIQLIHCRPVPSRPGHAEPEHRQHLGQRSALARQHDARAHDRHAHLRPLLGQRSKLGLPGLHHIGQEAGALRAGGRESFVAAVAVVAAGRALHERGNARAVFPHGPHQLSRAVDARVADQRLLATPSSACRRPVRPPGSRRHRPRAGLRQGPGECGPRHGTSAGNGSRRRAALTSRTRQTSVSPRAASALPSSRPIRPVAPVIRMRMQWSPWGGQVGGRRAGAALCPVRAAGTCVVSRGVAWSGRRTVLIGAPRRSSGVDAIKTAGSALRAAPRTPAPPRSGRATWPPPAAGTRAVRRRPRCGSGTRRCRPRSATAASATR